MPDRKILILGGTAEARALAELLVSDGGFHVTTSLAGRTRAPLMPPGEVRSGGFGGAEGLAHYLERERFDMVVDATHPFAAEISQNAHQACSQTGTALLRLERPAWKASAGDDWLSVPDVAAAAAALMDGDKALVTVGRQELAPFLARERVSIIARMIEPPDGPVPGNAEIIIARPPFTLEDEHALMEEHGITVLVAKNSGGKATAAKLTAARERGVRVIMVERPQLPGVPAAASAEELLRLITATLPD